MASQSHTLHVAVLPFMAAGHMIPMIDVAKLFAARGVTITILTTLANAPLIQSSIDTASTAIRHRLRLAVLPLPSPLPGVPDGCESMDTLTSHDERMEFIVSTAVLRAPFKRALEEVRPDCVLADVFFPWATGVAGELGLTRLVFDGRNFFTHCVEHSLWLHQPHVSVAGDRELFLVPGLPHHVEMTRSRLADYSRLKPAYLDFFMQMVEAEKGSSGVIVNSFYELEPDYVEHSQNVMGRKVWHVGPVSLCNKDSAEKVARGYKTSSDPADCLKWLDGKPPGSVLYLCFGSMFQLSRLQLCELALGLEASGHPFIWVMKSGTLEWLPEGYEEKVVVDGGKGLIIRGWAPQAVILGHRAVGGFVTHCGWNSCLESIAAGVPMIAWPFFADQFQNERLIVGVLRVGLGVGVDKYLNCDEDEMELVGREKVVAAVVRLMGGGEEAEGMRGRVKELGEMARRAVKEGGSSYKKISMLIQELVQMKETGPSWSQC